MSAAVPPRAGVDRSLALQHLPILAPALGTLALFLARALGDVVLTWLAAAALACAAVLSPLLSRYVRAERARVARSIPLTGVVIDLKPHRIPFGDPFGCSQLFAPVPLIRVTTPDRRVLEQEPRGRPVRVEVGESVPLLFDPRTTKIDLVRAPLPAPPPVWLEAAIIAACAFAVAGIFAG